MTASTVKFGNFKWDKGGYAQLKNSAPMQGMLNRKAQAMVGQANASVSDNGYAVDTATGALAGDTLRIVHAASAEAMYDNAKHNTLLKTL